MGAKPKPRRLYSCPRCGELVVRVYTAAQFGQPLSSLVAEYRGVEQSAQLGFSAPLNGFRAKGFQHATFFLFTAGDVVVVVVGLPARAVYRFLVFHNPSCENGLQRNPIGDYHHLNICKLLLTG
jgi:hypothetical protein